jgi:PAS domain S-box-containing protein
MRMRDGNRIAGPGAPPAEEAGGEDSATAAIAGVLAATPAAQALFDPDGRCLAASPAFTRLASAAADAQGRLSPDFLARADLRALELGGRECRLVTLPEAAAPPPQASLAGLEAVLRGVFDTFPAVVTVKDREGRFVYVNAFHAGLYGTTPDRIVGRPAAEVLGARYSDGPGELDRRVLEGGEAIPFFEQVFAAGEGGPRHWLTTKIPLRDGDAVAGVTTIALDIEDRKQLEEMLLETKKAAEAASQAKTMFLAQVSHELRTPLNAIIGFTEMMTQEIFGPMGAPQYRGYAQDVLKAARHLLGIITDMLDVTRLDAGALELALAPVPPGELVTEAARMVALNASAKRVQLRHYVELGLPPLKADARRLRQALINLIANAVKFTPEGGTVSFGARRVAAAPAVAAGSVELYVEDNGIGMSPDEIAVALTVFGRVRGGYAKSQEGTGIGLPLAKALIERHGGRFVIDSEPGRGTKIRAIFPPACLAADGAA